MVAQPQTVIRYAYKGEPTGANCGHPCRGRLRVREAQAVENPDSSIAVVCERCGTISRLIARYAKLHKEPEREEMENKTTAIVPWVRAAMDVPKDEVAKVLPGYSALWGDKVPQEIKVLCARVALAYGLDPLAGELIILGGKPYTTCQGRIRNAERHEDYEGFDTEWVVDPKVRAAMGLRDGDICIEATGYRKGRRPCKAWGIVRSVEIGGGRNPIAQSNPQEMAYKRGVERCLRHMYAMPLPGVEESPVTEADYYRQNRVDVVTGEVTRIDGELNVSGCTEDQRKAIHALVNELDIPEHAYHAELERLFNVGSSMYLTSGQAAEYLDALTARLKAHQKGSPMAEPEDAEAEFIAEQAGFDPEAVDEPEDVPPPPTAATAPRYRAPQRYWERWYELCGEAKRAGLKAPELREDATKEEITEAGGKLKQAIEIAAKLPV